MKRMVYWCELAKYYTKIYCLLEVQNPILNEIITTSQIKIFEPLPIALACCLYIANKMNLLSLSTFWQRWKYASLNPTLIPD